MAYRDDGQLNATANIVGLLSALVSASGLLLAIANPQIYSEADLRVAYTKGWQGEAVPATYASPSTRIWGSVMAVAGLIGLGASAALSTTAPSSLSPASVSLADDDIPGGEPDPNTPQQDRKALVVETQTNVAKFLKENPVWGRALLSKMLFITGPQGAGKTTAAIQGYQFGQLLNNEYVIVANPHHALEDSDRLDYATANELWSTAEDIRKNLPQLLLKANTIGRKNHKRVRLVCDEFSNWPGLYSLPVEAKSVIELVSQGARKSFLAVTIIAHSEKKGMVAGEDGESGRVESVLRNCAVMDIAADPPEIGEDDPKWTGRAELSDQGQHYSKPRHKVQLPAVMHPASFAKKLGPYLTTAILAKRPALPSAEKTATQTLTDAVENFDFVPFVPPSAAEIPTSGPHLNGNIADWRRLFELPKAYEFCRWLRRQTVSVGDEFEIEFLRANFGRNHSLNTAELCRFLAALDSSGLGRLDSFIQPRRWTAKVSYQTIPELEAAGDLS